MTLIALVNDDVTFLDLVEELLAERGWECVKLQQGTIAFQTIKERQPDLVLLDIRMEQPDTGWRVLTLLTLDPETRQIPVIMCSADWNELHAKEVWLSQRGIGTLPRPFDLDDLYRAVEKGLVRPIPTAEENPQGDGEPDGVVAHTAAP